MTYSDLRIKYEHLSGKAADDAGTRMMLVDKYARLAGGLEKLGRASSVLFDHQRRTNYIAGVLTHRHKISTPASLLRKNGRRPASYGQRTNDDREVNQRMNPAADPEYLGRLLDEQGGVLALYASQWTDAADDCVQEALLELVLLPELPLNVPAWLFRVVRNRAIGRARAQQRRKRHEARAGQDLPLESRTAREPEWSAAEVTAALDEIEGDLREVVVARVWGNLGFEAIAELTGTSVSTAHRRYEAGLQALRTRLGISLAAKTGAAKK